MFFNAYTGTVQRQPRNTRAAAIQKLEQRYKEKADLRGKELQLKERELDLMEKKLNMEEKERSQRLELEREERKAWMEVLKKHL